jgi:hypothetical protein
MRKVLNILLVAVVLSPAFAGLTFSAPVQSCECEPAACHCPAHDHSSAHGPMCAFANGGRCGVKSSDLALSTLSSRSDILIGEAFALPLLFSKQHKKIVPPASDRAGHDQPPTPPPRSQA